MSKIPDIPPTLIRDVATKLLGEPNKHLSTTHELRYGTHGSLSIKCRDGTWFDHEAGGGGGILALIERETGAAGAERWKKLEELTGWKAEESKPNGTAKPRSKIVAAYDYTDAGGVLRYQVVRLEPKSFRQRRPDGKGGWSWSTKGLEPLPYRLPELLAAVAAGQPVVIVEGEKDADNLARLGIPASCNHGGAGKFKPELVPHFAGADVVLIGDNDQAGRDHVNAVGAALAGTAKSIRAIDLAAVWSECPDKGDVSDWIEAGADLDALVAAAKGASAWVAPAATVKEEKTTDAFKEEKAGDDDTGASTLQGGFLLVRRWTNYLGKRIAPGVYVVETPNGDDEEIKTSAYWLCSRLEPLAKSRDKDSMNWGRLLEIYDSDEVRHIWAMPMTISPTVGDGVDFRRELARLGVEMAPNRKARDLLANYVITWRSKRKVRCVSSIGWCGDAFVMPDETFGGSEEVVLQVEGAPPDFTAAGTLDGWKAEIAARCVGNSRLVLGVSAAFAGPLLRLAGEESGGIHFRGASSIGKTTALHAARSVWGTPLGSWRTTDNAAEGIAAGACDALLTLDEIGQAPPKVVGELAYMLGNGRGKGRMKRDGSARASHRWRVLFLSTGEVGLATRLLEGGDKARAGQEVRVLEIAADAGKGLGAFERLHGFSNGGMLAEHLRLVSDKHCGHPAREYLRHITNDTAAIATTISNMRKAFVADSCPADADGQVRRACGRFGIIAAGGEVATQAGITGWQPGEARAAAVRCWQDWLAERGGTGAAETREAFAQVRLFLEQHGEARFSPCWDVKNDKPVINRAGFRKSSDDGWTYYVLPEVWRREVCKGLDAKAVASAMAERGWIEREGRHLTCKPRIPGEGHQRVYVVSPAFLSADT